MNSILLNITWMYHTTLEDYLFAVFATIFIECLISTVMLYWVFNEEGLKSERNSLLITINIIIIFINLISGFMTFPYGLGL